MDTRLFTISQIRMIEKKAIEEYQIPEFNLMLNAGKAAFNFLRVAWPKAKKLLILCSSGNNGGDGLVLARLAHEDGLVVWVRTMGDAAHFSQSTQSAFDACKAVNIDIKPFSLQESLTADVVVDALLGIGLKRPIEGDYAKIISTINESNLPVLALDVPSGIDADSGSVLGSAIKASATITFIGLKQGLFTNDALDHCGKIAHSDLDLPSKVYKSVVPNAELLTPKIIKEYLPKRRKNVHKGNFGHVLVIGGFKGMAGAARLAAEAALRVGAGWVSVATLPEHQSIICALHPEIMCHGVKNPRELLALLKKATVIILGPGLGQDDWGRELFRCALTATFIPKVIDADALNLMGREPPCQKNWVLTPHPGEAAHLLGYDSARQVQENRFAAIDKLSSLGGTWVLKGAGTLVKHSDVTSVCGTGNPGMASAGMGDALSGIIGGLLSQQIPPELAAKVGATLHGLAGDEAAKQGERGLLASDLIQQIRLIANPKT